MILTSYLPGIANYALNKKHLSIFFTVRSAETIRNLVVSADKTESKMKTACWAK